jgi:hypothetical protein
VELIKLETNYNIKLRSETKRKEILNMKYEPTDNVHYLLHEGTKQEIIDEDINYSEYMNNDPELMTIRENIISLKKEIYNLVKEIYNLIKDND